MNATRPQDQIRGYLEQQQGPVEVPFHNLLTSWGIEDPSPDDRVRIQESLAGVGIAVQPPLDDLDRDSTTTLSLASEEPPPWSTPPAPQPQAAAPPVPPAAAQPQPAAPPPPPAPAPAPSAQAMPTAQPQAAPPQPQTGALTRGAPPANLVALPLIAAGALLAILSTFLGWVEGVTYWEIANFGDVAILLLGLTTIGLCIAGLVARRARSLRIALIPLAVFFSLSSLMGPIDFMLILEPNGGPVVATLGALLALAGLVLLVMSDLLGARDAPPPAIGIAIAALAAAAIVGLFATVAQLLPSAMVAGESTSEWEFARVADIFDQLMVLALIGAALIAVLARRVPSLAVGAALLLAFFGLSLLVTAIEIGWVKETDFYPAAVLNLFAGLLGLAASVLLLATAYPRGGEQPRDATA